MADASILYAAIEQEYAERFQRHATRSGEVVCPSDHSDPDDLPCPTCGADV